MMEEKGLVGLLSEWFALFAAETGILGEVRQYQDLGKLLLIMLAVLLCFLGIRTYHLAVAVWMYMVVILLSSFLFRDRMNWGAVVTFFAVTGFAMAFLAYQWNYTGAVLTTGLIAGVFASFAGLSMIWIILCILLGGVAAIWFPGPGVCLSTSLFGGVVLAEFIPAAESRITGVYILTIASGLGLQILLAKKGGLLKREGIKKS
ncbi:MAG: hypothetical protein K2P41_04065 [Lachnospiraceae bacterium]|nr:hypothetical protein [Lachnospiraceae bacterium]